MASTSSTTPATTMTPYAAALAAIDAAHSEDPNLTSITTSPSNPSFKSTPAPTDPTATTIPYELHYAQKSTHYLNLHTPHASPLLQLAVRAQHLRRWEVPRSSYPMNRAGYLSWRTALKNRQAKMVEEICRGVGVSEEESEVVAALVRKEGLLSKKTDEGATEGRGSNDDSTDGGGDGGYYSDVQILEDVACLVFLDDQFEEFERKFVEESGSTEQDQQEREEKVVNILKKTWAKMSPRGHELALQMEMSDRGKELVKRALNT